MRTAIVEVFGDFACPWCYIVSRRLQAARQFLASTIRSRLVWRALRIGRAAAEEAMARPDTRRFLTSVGAAEGIHFALDRIARVPDTAAAHNLVRRIRRGGHGDEIIDQLVERVYHALWSEGRDIDSPATLAQLAAAVGADTTATEEWDAGLDQRRAAAVGIDAIPFVLINGHVGVRGTRSTRHFAEAIQGASWFDEGRASTLVAAVA